MLSPGSRYLQIEVASLTVTRDGVAVEIPFLRRRFIPPTTGQVTFVLHTVKQGDRLDNITARYLADPTLFWRICDANTVLRPAELTETLGHVIDVALPLLAGSGK
jgi:hypothetical protein